MQTIADVLKQLTVREHEIPWQRPLLSPLPFQPQEVEKKINIFIFNESLLQMTWLGPGWQDSRPTCVVLLLAKAFKEQLLPYESSVSLNKTLHLNIKKNKQLRLSQPISVPSTCYW